MSKTEVETSEYFLAGKIKKTKQLNLYQMFIIEKKRMKDKQNALIY